MIWSIIPWVFIGLVYAAGYIFCLAHVGDNIVNQEYNDKLEVFIVLFILLTWPVLIALMAIYLGCVAFSQNKHGFKKPFTSFRQLPLRYDHKAHQVIKSL